MTNQEFLSKLEEVLEEHSFTFVEMTLKKFIGLIETLLSEEESKDLDAVFKTICRSIQE